MYLIFHPQGGLYDENKLLTYPIIFTKRVTMVANHTTGQSVTVEMAIRPTTDGLTSAVIVTSTPTLDGKAYWLAIGS